MAMEKRKLILPLDYQKCTGLTKSGVKCIMKQNCKRYLSYTLDDDVYKPVGFAPETIKNTPFECDLLIENKNKIHE